jgi:hypothetical protein
MEEHSVTFEEDRFAPRRVVRRPSFSLVPYIIKYSGGRIKTEAQANTVMLAIAIFALAASLFLFFTIQDEPQPASPELLRAYGKTT